VGARRVAGAWPLRMCPLLRLAICLGGGAWCAKKKRSGEVGHGCVFARARKQLKRLSSRTHCVVACQQAADAIIENRLLRGPLRATNTPHSSPASAARRGLTARRWTSKAARSSASATGTPARRWRRQRLPRTGWRRGCPPTRTCPRRAPPPCSPARCLAGRRR